MINKKKNKRIAMILACILIPVGAFGFGYFFRNDEKNKQVANTLTVDGSIGGSIVENFEPDTGGIVPGDVVDETINIKPNATAPSLLRVKIDPSWKGGQNEESLTTSNLEIIYAEGVNVSEKLAINNGDYWFKADDGYLYYMNYVKNTQPDISLVKGIKFNGGSDDTDANKYQGRQLNIKVTMDMVQCKHDAFVTKWNISKDSNLGDKLKNICNSTSQSN